MGVLSTVRFILNHPVNQSHRLDALKRYVRWQVGSRLVQGQVMCDWILGLKLLVRSGETGLTGNLYCGLHEFSTMAYVLHTLTPDDLFVDVGANVGSYTLLASGGVGARSYSFEPVPETFARLSLNLQVNRLDERVKALNIGVGEGEGELLFTSDEDTVNHVVRPGESSHNTIAVKVRTLDHVLQGESPNLIKIDVEGFETPVINGALETLRKPSLHSVIMELNGSGEQYGYSEKALYDQMISLGFRPYTYDPMTRTLAELGGKDVVRKDQTHDNTLFIRDVEQARARLRSTPKVDIYGSSL